MHLLAKIVLYLSKMHGKTIKIKCLFMCAVCRLTEKKLGGVVGNSRQAGHFGDYNCGSPWALVESAVEAMKKKHGENIEFVLWTG